MQGGASELVRVISRFQQVASCRGFDNWPSNLCKFVSRFPCMVRLMKSGRKSCRLTADLMSHLWSTRAHTIGSENAKELLLNIFLSIKSMITWIKRRNFPGLPTDWMLR